MIRGHALLGGHVTDHRIGLAIVSSHAQPGRTGSPICRSPAPPWETVGLRETVTASLGLSGELEKANQRHAAMDAQAAFALPAASSQLGVGGCALSMISNVIRPLPGTSRSPHCSMMAVGNDGPVKSGGGAVPVNR